MKKIFSVFLAACSVLAMTSPVWAGAQDCARIQDATIVRSSDAVLIETGFDEWGYNYQAHMFNGTYCDAYHDTECPSWAQDLELMMKWNDAFLSNKDCDGDGLLDRHYGFDSYIGSGAWLTEHRKGIYIDDNGKTKGWEFFIKLVAAPADAYSDGGSWYAADGSEIGPIRPGMESFAATQLIYNDTGMGLHGILYLSPLGAGLGRYGPQD